MKKRRILIIFIAVIVIIAFGIAVCAWRRNESKQSKGCTMKEAYAIALESAKKWSEDAEAIVIISTDNHDTELVTNGIDGVRNCWTFLFSSEKAGKQYSMYVINGEPYAECEATAPGYKGIVLDEKMIDTDKAYEIALQEGINGGVDWAWGYHYDLQYTYRTADSTEPELTLGVRGSFGNGNDASIVLDPYSGEIISISEMVAYDDDGHAIWQEKYTKPEENTESEETELTREDVMELYDVFAIAAEYYMDPDEITDYIIHSEETGYFSLYTEVKQYEKEEWEQLMTEKYGEEWHEW